MKKATPIFASSARLAGSRPDAHHHYNGLVQRLVSFAQAAECTR